MLISIPLNSMCIKFNVGQVSNALQETIYVHLTNVLHLTKLKFSSLLTF